MTLAEALIMRSDLNKKIQSLKERIARNAVVQEGNIAHEDPAAIFKEACGASTQLKELVIKIEAANQIAKTADGRLLADALAERDDLIRQHSFVNSALDGANKEPDRYGLKEIKWVATIKVSDYQKRMDDYSKKIRDLNIHIQAANWKFEIK